jgi:two-component system sensor histidine kinase DesK
MALTLVPAPRHPLAWRLDDRSRVGATLNESALARQSARLAYVTVIAFTITGPVVSLVRFAVSSNHKPLAAMVVATLLYAPLLARLTWPAVHGRRAPAAGRTLAALAVVVIGATPFIGVNWLATYAVLAFALLIVLDAPWSWLGFACVVAAPVVIATANGSAQDGLYGTLFALKGVAPFAMIQLVVAAQRLDAARAALVAQAVVQERLRIDVELRSTIDAELTVVAALGQQATSMPEQHADQIERQLGELVGRSRGALTHARRIIRAYQRPSLRAELDTAAALLRAGGIEAIVHAPDEEVTGTVDKEVRAELRRVTAQLLREEPAKHCVITLRRSGEAVTLQVSADEVRRLATEPSP